MSKSERDQRGGHSRRGVCSAGCEWCARRNIGKANDYTSNRTRREREALKREDTTPKN